jgi:hypothetical protein
MGPTTIPIPIAGPAARLADLMLELSARPGRACKQSGLMLARILPDGVFELLSAAAWAEALGYPQHELSGKSLRELMPLGKPAASELVACLLAEEHARPVDITLRCKDRRPKCFRLHRRIDAYEKAIFVLADELVEDRVEPRRAYA